MKVVNIKLNKNFPQHMSGREVAVYIYRYNPKLNEDVNEIDDINENNEDIKKRLYIQKMMKIIINFGLIF